MQAVTVLVQVVQEEITVIGGGGGQDLDSIVVEVVVSTCVCGEWNHVSLLGNWINSCSQDISAGVDSCRARN